jgi:hypothetical protein
MSISTICTDFSVKDFVKRFCTNQYDLTELDQLANDMSKQSSGSISHNSALNMLSRYANVNKNSTIVFNPDRRNPDQNYAELKTKINDGSFKTNIIENSDSIKTTNIIKSNPVTTETATKDAKSNPVYKPSANTSSTNSTNGAKPKGRGFGNLNQLKKIIDEPKQIVSPPRVESDVIVPKKIETNKRVESDVIVPKKIETNKREVNLFKSVKSDQTHDEKSSSSIPTKPKRSGFGVFNKSLIKEDTSKTESVMPSIRPTITKYSDKMIGQQNFSGVKRTDPLYGPYGTDNFHDEHHYDDIITDETKHSVDI